MRTVGYRAAEVVENRGPSRLTRSQVTREVIEAPIASPESRLLLALFSNFHGKCKHLNR